MPCIPPKKIRPILFIEQVQTDSDIPRVTLSIRVINWKHRARVPDSYAWIAAVAAHIWIIASRCGRGSVRGVVRVWGGRGALVCPVGDTFFQIERIGMLVQLDDEKKNMQGTGSHEVELNIPRRLIHSLTKKPHSRGQLSSSVEFLLGGANRGGKGGENKRRVGISQVKPPRIQIIYHSIVRDQGCCKSKMRESHS